MTGSIPTELRALVTERADARCEYCGLAQAGQEATFHIDHMVPRSAGGPTDEANLALACVGCSLRKGARQVVTDPATEGSVPLFKIRERHGEWRVQITPDDDPLGDAEDWERAIWIANGDEDELQVDDQLVEVGALRVAVGAVRDALVRNSCSHESPSHAGHRHCSLCGVPLDQAAAWRWSN